MIIYLKKNQSESERENHRFIRCIFWLELNIISPEFPAARLFASAEFAALGLYRLFLHLALLTKSFLSSSTSERLLKMDLGMKYAILGDK